MESSFKSAGDFDALPASKAPTGNPGAAALGGLSSRDGSVTLHALIDAYMSAYSGRDGSRTQRLAFWDAQFGAVHMDQLSDDDIFGSLEMLAGRRGRFYAGKDADGDKILKSKARPLSPASLNRYQAALSAVLTWAQKRRIAPKNWQNPCRHIELRPENNERVRFLSDLERTALLAACLRCKWPRMYVLVLTALTTGARRGELEALRWSHVDLARAEATIVFTKNNDRKVLPLVPAVVEQLKRFEGAPGGLVFPSKQKPDVAFNFSKVWDEVKGEAGVKNFRFHDLRHSCASALAQSGATLLEIADVLGHRQLSVTKRYSHLAIAHKSKLVNRVLGDFR
jgi:integrase